MSGTDTGRYLRAIMGGEPQASLLEVRPLAIGGGAYHEGRGWYRLDEQGLAEAEGEILRLSAWAQVYVGVAPRALREGHAGAVNRVWCLWADIDSAQDVRDRLWPFRPHPSIVVRSGSGGAHAYWLLEEPLAPSWAQRANRRLALALRADPKATDPARILRPPGTFNHKREPAALVEATRLTDLRFKAGDVVGDLPDTQHYRRPATPARPAAGGETSDRQLDGLCRTIVEAPEGGRNDALFWAACRAIEHVDAGGLAEGRMLDALSSAALEAGLQPAEVRATLGSARRASRRVPV